MKNSNTLVLAHYYTEPKVQQLADFVGDSLDLSLKAQESGAERIVMAGVQFMAETVKIINPSAQVILPDATSTCSLVTQSNETHNHGNAHLTLEQLIPYVKDEGFTIVTYINSSYQVKAKSDVIVTSANVEQIITDLINDGDKVYFTPDRNMGAYLAHTNPYWDMQFQYYKQAVCEVHDRFVKRDLELEGWTDGFKYLLAHPESPLPVLKRADFVGSTSKLLKYITDFPTNKPATFFVATEEGLLYNMKKARPDLDIRLAPVYTGCKCNSCPYMKKNTVDAVMGAIYGNSGFEIDYIPEDVETS